jgi:hypothetical protein
VDFKAVEAGILKISKYKRAKQKKKDETKSEYQNDVGKAKRCKRVGKDTFEE